MAFALTERSNRSCTREFNKPAEGFGRSLRKSSPAVRQKRLQPAWKVGHKHGDAPEKPSRKIRRTNALAISLALFFIKKEYFSRCERDGRVHGQIFDLNTNCNPVMSNKLSVQLCVLRITRIRLFLRIEFFIQYGWFLYWKDNKSLKMVFYKRSLTFLWFNELLNIINAQIKLI